MNTLPPAFLPALSPHFDLDHLVLPYAEQVCQRVLISVGQCDGRLFEELHAPVWVDSGGFAALYGNAQVLDLSGLGALIYERGAITPQYVRAFASSLNAEVEFTLDFPTRDDSKRATYTRLSEANALWRLSQPRDRRVFAAVQPGQSLAGILAAEPDGIGLGGLVRPLPVSGAIPNWWTRSGRCADSCQTVCRFTYLASVHRRPSNWYARLEPPVPTLPALNVKLQRVGPGGSLLYLIPP